MQETSAPFILILCWLGLQVRQNVHNLREAAAPLTFDLLEPGRQIHRHVCKIGLTRIGRFLLLTMRKTFSKVTIRHKL